MDRHTGYKEIHYNKMAHTSQHHKDMKYFVGAEILMLRIEDRKLQRIDHTADGIDDAAGRAIRSLQGRLWKIGTKASTHSQPIPM